MLCPARIVGERAESGYFHSRSATRRVQSQEGEREKRKKSSSSDSTDRYIRRATVMVVRTFNKMEKKKNVRIIRDKFVPMDFGMEKC